MYVIHTDPSPIVMVKQKKIFLSVASYQQTCSKLIVQTCYEQVCCKLFQQVVTSLQMTNATSLVLTGLLQLDEIDKLVATC